MLPPKIIFHCNHKLQLLVKWSQLIQCQWTLHKSYHCNQKPPILNNCFWRNEFNHSVQRQFLINVLLCNKLNELLYTQLGFVSDLCFVYPFHFSGGDRNQYYTNSQAYDNGDRSIGRVVQATIMIYLMSTLLSSNQLGLFCLTLQKSPQLFNVDSDRGSHIEPAYAYCSCAIIGHFPKSKMTAEDTEISQIDFI